MHLTEWLGHLRFRHSSRSAIRSSLSDDIAETRRLHSEEKPLPERLFAVVSWGCAGTHWLSKALNDCPQIYCAHASNSLWTHFAGAQTLDGLDYLRLVGMLGSGNIAAGDVHGLGRHEISIARETFGDRFRAAVLIRDPLPRLYSQLAFFEKFAPTRCWDTEYLKEKFPDVEAMLPAGGYGEWLFVHGANMLNNIIDEVTVAPVIRLEDISTKPRALMRLVRALTEGQVDPTEDWAHRAVTTEKTNRHAIRAQRLTGWQRRVLEAVVEDRAIELYRELGYRFSLKSEPAVAS
jgi:hypothetical protein